MWRFFGLLMGVLLLTGFLLWWMDGWRSLADIVSVRTSPTMVEARELKVERRAYDGEEQEPVPSTSLPSSGVGAFQDPVTVTGCNLAAVVEQDLPSQVDGVFEEINVDLGHRVRRGQVLGRLESSKARLLVELYRMKVSSDLGEKLARAKHEEAKVRVKGDEQASRDVRGAVSGFEYRLDLFQRDQAALEIQKAQEDRQAAELELKKVRQELEMHTLRSALAGEVVRVYKRNGEAIKQWEPAFRVADFNRLRVEGFLPAQQAALVRPGMRALVEPELPSQAVTELHGHTAAVTGLAITPDGRYLASASEDRTVLLWPCGQPGRRAVLGHPAEVYAVACAGGAVSREAAYRLLTGCADGCARLWHVTASGGVAGPALKLADKHQGPIRAVAFSADGKWCATGGEDKKIGLWEAAGGQFLYFLQDGPDSRATAHRGPVTMVHFTPDGQLVSAGRDNVLKVWKLGGEAAEVIRRHAGRSGDVPQPGVSADGRWLLVDHGNELRILGPRGGQERGALRSPEQGHFQALAVFSPSGERVLTAAANGRLQLWNVPASPEATVFFRQGYRVGFQRHSLSALAALSCAPPGPVLVPAWAALAALPPGKPLPQAEGAADCELPALWDLDGHEVRHLITPDAAVATCGVFAPDETVVYTGGNDKIIRVWGVPPAARERQPLEAQVTFVGSGLDSGTGMVRVRAELGNPREPARRLRAGMHATLVLYPETAGKGR